MRSRPRKTCNARLEQVRTASPSVKESPQARYGLLRTVLVVCGFLALLFLSAWHVAGLRP